mmetsp:Transcript_16361/g.32926  ORF Transcript_16361/g.32926 Transcript_16361/m.32926 type:complete len:381 (-) Transcript_16361:157-1299(-)
MIFASAISRLSFLAGASSSLGTLIARPNISNAATTTSISTSMTPGAMLEQQTPSIVTSFLSPNVRNAPQSSSALRDEEREAMMSLASRIVRNSAVQYLKNDASLAGPLLRLAFHDAATREQWHGEDTSEKADTLNPKNGAFTGGPNGSVRYELEWSESRGLSKPLRVIDDIYGKVRGLDLSYADCIALAGAAAVEYAGGPHIAIKLGRVDSAVADDRKRRRILRMDTDRSVVDTTLPSPALDSDGLRLYFGALGLSEEELVALCGAHDLGRHVTLLNMPKECLKNLTRTCLEEAPVMMPFVSEGPDTISNAYFKKLLKWYDRKVEMGEVAFIPTDVALVVDEGLRIHVQRYSRDEKAFFDNFLSAYQKLVDASATTNNRY